MNIKHTTKLNIKFECEKWNSQTTNGLTDDNEMYSKIYPLVNGMHSTAIQMIIESI